MINFGQNVRKRRTDLNISQSALAKLLNCNRRYVSQLESGNIDVTLSTIYKLSIKITRVKIKNAPTLLAQDKDV